VRQHALSDAGALGKLVLCQSCGLAVVANFERDLIHGAKSTLTEGIDKTHAE